MKTCYNEIIKGVGEKKWGCVKMSNSNLDNQIKKLSPNQFGRNSRAEIDRKYQIYCIKRHLLYLTREELHRSVIKGHVITALRINDFMTFGLEKKQTLVRRHG